MPDDGLVVSEAPHLYGAGRSESIKQIKNND
jgi:hypothetical protein